QRARHHPARLAPRRRAGDGADRLRIAARIAQSHARRRPAAAAARHLRPVDHHPERAPGILHRRQPQAAGRRHRGGDATGDERIVDRAAAAPAVRHRRGGDCRPAASVLSHRARPRLPRHLRRPGGGAAHGPRHPPCLRAGHGDIARGRRHRRRVPRRTRQFRSGHRPGATDLRLRGSDHRWPRQHVGHARRRRHPRRGAGNRRAARSRLAAARRARRLPRHPRLLPARPVPQGVGMSIVAHATTSSRIGVTLIALTAVALAAAPLWASQLTLRLLAEMFTFIVLASLWNLLAGYAGLVSVGQQAYVGLGGYLLFGLAMFGGVPPVLAILVAGPVSAIIAIPVAAVMFRLRGAYFAIGTWVMAEVFRLVASQVAPLGGGSGISLPASIILAMAKTRTAREYEIYWLALALMAAVLGTIVLLLRSRHGLALTAIRDNELAAQSNGVDVRRLKLAVYLLTAFGTGMAGALIF